MKRILISIVALLITLSAFAQSRPTKKVINSFTEKYQTAEIIRWENETERNKVTLWKAFFKQDDVLSVAWYDPKANWIQTKTEINKDELPGAVMKKIGDNVLINIASYAGLEKYIVEKGSITVNGISLTVTFSKGPEFGVSVIPQTFKETTLSTIRTGSSVNLETDIIAKHIEKLIAGKSGLTLHKLKELGY